MSSTVYVAVEDALGLAVARRLLTEHRPNWTIGTVLGMKGNQYLRQRITSFNRAAASVPYLVLTDLDAIDCAPTLKHEWLPEKEHANLLFRVAVREVEAWILADRAGFAGLLGVRTQSITSDAESLEDPKAYLIGLARRSRRRAIRDDIVPRPGSTATKGRGYNSLLGQFVRERWDLATASSCSDSLARTVARIRQLPSHR